MQLHYNILQKENMHFWEKSRKCQRQRNYQLVRKQLQNYCIKDQVTDPPDHCWMGIMLIFGKILRSRHFLHIMSNCFNEQKTRSKIPLKPKAPLKLVFMEIIPSTAPKRLTCDTKFPNYLLIVDAYSIIPKLYSMDKITTEEVMYKLDMFQSI